LTQQTKLSHKKPNNIYRTDRNRQYRLSRAGEDAVRVIKDVESWAEVADVDRKTTFMPIASFFKANYAFLIDFFIMFAISGLFLLEVVVSMVAVNGIVMSITFFSSLGAPVGLLDASGRLQRTKHRQTRLRIKSYTDRRQKTHLRTCSGQELWQGSFAF
jgi:hypothetical protein